MRAWLARGIDLSVAAALVRPRVSRLRARTDPAALERLVAQWQSCAAHERLPGVRSPQGPVTVTALSGGANGARRFDVTFPSSWSSGQATNDLVRARLVLHAGHSPLTAGDLAAAQTAGGTGPTLLGPTLIVVPGWLTPSAREYEFLIAPTVTARAVNVLIFETPWHHRRTPPGYLSGVLALSGDLVRSAGFLAQALSDMGNLIAWLRGVGCPAVGVWGESLGGWLTCLVAAMDADLALAMPTVPVVHPELVFARSPLLPSLRRDVRASRLPKGLAVRALRMMSPLVYPRRLPAERMVIVGADYEMLLPDNGPADLAAHWAPTARLVCLPEGHISVRLARDFHTALAEAVDTHMAGGVVAPAGRFAGVSPP